MENIFRNKKNPEFFLKFYKFFIFLKK